MEYRTLGTTGLVVSRLCFGTLTISPLQAGLPVDEGARVIRHALTRGVNFIDCAELYGTYPYVREALRDGRREAVVATKSYAYTREMMWTSLERARRELDRDCIDLFLLHEQESLLTIRGHWEALEFLLEARERGRVRAVGISTHHVAAVEAAAAIPEIEVIHPLYNVRGIGIRDGTAADMLAAIRRARAAGKGVYGMKALGGGHLLTEPLPALHEVLARPEFDAVAIGMRSTLEVEYNVRVFDGQTIPEGLTEILRRTPRRLHVEDWCVGCGSCAAACQANALELVEGRPRVDQARCCLCGYCAAACPEFCIKVVLSLRILGLDLGERRIGVALSDEAGLTAQALEVIERRGAAEDLAHIAELVRRYGVERIVVGLPKNMDGSIGPAAEKALAFAGELKAALGLPVDTWDERLSTVEANRILVGADVRRARRRKIVDKLAAAVILDGYMASRRR